MAERLQNVVCPQCKKPFELRWEDYRQRQVQKLLDDVRGKGITLHIRDCPSDGVYDVTIECPHCDYEEEL